MKTYQYQHTDGHITDKQFSSDHTALRFLEEIGPNWQLVTPVEDVPLLEYHRADTAPDADGLVLSVRFAGQTIGSLICFTLNSRAPRPVLRWYGKNAAGTASGNAYETREEAAADVLAWHEGRTPAYVQHAVVPLAACAGSCATCGKNA